MTKAWAEDSSLPGGKLNCLPCLPCRDKNASTTPTHGNLNTPPNLRTRATKKKLKQRYVASNLSVQESNDPTFSNDSIHFLQDLFKVVRGILNKITPSKFDKLLESIKSLNIDTEDRLAGVIKLFFEKAVDEPIFSSTYAKMCLALSSKEVVSAANEKETTTFRKLLLTRCQKEFEKDNNGLLIVEEKKKEVANAETVPVYSYSRLQYLS